MRSIATLNAAGKTDPGRQRAVNEDRLYVDASRGLFIVIDGIGGQAAGGKAADVALSMLRTRLERETGPVELRIREAITIANNEIHRLAASRPEWNGMACVVTLAVVDSSRAVIGHVGDTRLYKLTPRGIEKVTHDHSPVGEREDANELSELEAMHHPRRNEVYRDVGSDPHEPDDDEFIDIIEIPFEPDSALLLCSDGLTDLIESAAIDQIAREFAGEPDQVVNTLVDAANIAGGKDNVTVVYVEGDEFALYADPTSRSGDTDDTSRLGSALPPPLPQGSQRARDLSAEASAKAEPRRSGEAAKAGSSERFVRIALLIFLVALVALSVARLPKPAATDIAATAPVAASSHQLIVQPGESIAAALKRASAGTEVMVEPGEYREALTLASNVRLVSRVPGGALLRLPATASEAGAAIVASSITGATLAGFRIAGDATTPLGTGVLVNNSELTIADIEISGAANVAIDVAGSSHVDIMASDVHDNPGAAIAIRPGAAARVTHNVFRRNGAAPSALTPIIIGDNTNLQFAANVFYGMTPGAIRTHTEPARAALVRDNWFFDLPARQPRPNRQPPPPAQPRALRSAPTQ
jgi:serine/threonine protein phosphatase PrpC